MIIKIDTNTVCIMMLLIEECMYRYMICVESDSELLALLGWGQSRETMERISRF